MLAFWRAFHYYSLLVGGSKLWLLILFFTRYLGVTQWPALAVLGWVIFLALRTGSDPLKRAGFCLAAAVPVAGILGALGNGTFWYLLLILLLLTASVWKQTRSQFQRKLLCVLLVTTLLLANFRTFINIAGVLTGQIDSRPSLNLAEVHRLESTPEHPAAH